MYKGVPKGVFYCQNYDLLNYDVISQRHRRGNTTPSHPATKREIYLFFVQRHIVRYLFAQVGVENNIS